jgi:putative endonuclease
MNLFRKKKPEPEHLKTGKWGEKMAARFLRKAGYRIVARRVRIDRDEIDLIAKKRNLLVFVEVKTRGSEKYGRPVSAIHQRKRLALQRSAIRYLKKLKKTPDYIRIDGVEVIGTRGDKTPTIRHLENIVTLDRYHLPRNPTD